MAKLHIHPVGLVLILLGLASWFLAMIGMATSTKFCVDNKQGDSVSCGQAFQQDWWAIFFELILLLIMLFTCFLNVFPKARYVYLTYLAMVTGLLTFTTGKMYTGSFNLGVYDVSLSSRAYDAAGVGAMFLCMVNFALIIFIGLGAAKTLEEDVNGGGAANGTPGGGQVAFSSLSTTGPATGIGMGQYGSSAAYGGQNEGMMKTGVPPAAPATF